MKNTNTSLSGFLGLIILILAVIPWVTIFMLEEAIEEGGLWNIEDTWQYDVSKAGSDFIDSAIGDIVYEIPGELTEEVIGDDTTLKEAMAIIGFFTFVQGWIVVGVLLAVLGSVFPQAEQDDYSSPPDLGSL